MTASAKFPYTYSVLRYVHDITTGEFINVGVVVSGGRGQVGAKFRTTFGRLKAAFPTLDADGFKVRMRALQEKFNRLSDGDLSATSTNLTAIELARSVLIADDSSLQWSALGSGVTPDFQKVVNALYQRFVTKHDHDPNVGIKKDDDEIWRKFRKELEARNVIGHLEEKVIEVADGAVKFEHAWKNGAWHCYEPVSLDLVNSASIREKAVRWLGQVTSIQDASEPFKVYFLVGKPDSDALLPAYTKALSILRKAPVSRVIEEDDAKAFSEEVATSIVNHASH